MSVSLLEPPPTRRSAPSPRPAAAPAQRRPRRRAEYVLPVALLVSALFHLLLLLFVRFAGPAGAPLVASPPVAAEPQGMRVIDIVPVPDNALPQVDEPEPVEEVRTPVAVPVAPRADTPPLPGAPVADPLSVAERISPRMGDARLFAPQDAAMPAPTDHEARALARLYGEMAAYNDSSAAAADAARRALDWTVEDGSGGRWGVGPDGKIHLGKLTLPLPLGFAPPPGRREEMAERTRRFGEIEDQRAREMGRATFDERVKAIRERNDAQRDSTRRSGSGR